MRLTDLLYSQQLNCLLNPYEEEEMDGDKYIPGMRVVGVESGVMIEAGVIVAKRGEEIGESQVMLDYHSGKFYLK